MTVGKFSGMTLQSNTERNGAVFLLRIGPVQDAEITLDGWTVKVARGVNAVIAYGSAGRSFTETYDAALTAANRGLDYMSARGLCDVAIRDAQDDCLVWWADDEGVVVRANVISTTVSHSSATLVARDAAGNAIPPNVPSATKHDAFRFIRMSRTSEYLFDSYRNMFLAFEALLSDIRPRQKNAKGRYEGEGAWFRAALEVADNLVPVASLAPKGDPSPVDWIYTNMYGDARSGLMHAKQGQAYHLPQDDQSRQQLQKSLNDLWLYISQLLDKHLGVVHMSGGLMLGGFRMMAEGFLSEVVAAVSADTTPANPQDELFAPAGGPIVELVSGSLLTSEPFLGTVVASCDVVELGGLPTIGRLGAMDKTGNAILLSALPGQIELGGSVKRFEIMLGIRGVNAAGPRTHFSA